MMLSDNSKALPFYDIISRYCDRCDLSSLNNQFVSSDRENVLNRLSFLSEVVLQSELNVFRKAGNRDYERFVNETSSTLDKDYPVLEGSLSGVVKNYYQFLVNVNSRLSNDWENIIASFKLNPTTNSHDGIHLDSTLGDNHSGEGVGLLRFSNGAKVVYKPRSSHVSAAYNYFISWVNSKLNTDLETFEVLDRGEYSWLEFVNNEKVKDKNDLAEYYHKAGILLACTLLLGSKDCHQENIIAAGRNPVIIDHETIIQPHFANLHGFSWENFHNVPSFSVLESLLIVNSNTGIPLNCVGYGINNYLEFASLETQIVNANTIDSERVTRFVNKKIVENNIPINEEKYVFVKKYASNFIDGFTRAYNMFSASKDELLSNNSPISFFCDKTVRYVWRPTFVYHKILRYLRNPDFMSSFGTYESKLYELLSKAYKSEKMGLYKFVLECEMEQMLNGDIPIFHLNSQDKFLKVNTKVEIFKYSCLENINHRINLFSPDHKNEQLKYIKQWSVM